MISIDKLGSVENIIDKTTSPIYKYYIDDIDKSLINKAHKAINIASNADSIMLKKKSASNMLHSMQKMILENII